MKSIARNWRVVIGGVAAGDQLILLSWFHRADRRTMRVHPRGDLNNPLTGVFATRSPDRPNPIGGVDRGAQQAGVVHQRDRKSVV